jgi:2OG-Fe(II) oxygenase superfamily
VLNVQRGTTMRFECHIDSNPLTGVLFCTDHAGGGELVIGHDADAADIAAVEEDCSVVRPHSGHLILFDARQHPHYARPLTAESDMRVVAVMNFYTESCPESTRPRELNRHLYGEDLASVSGQPRWCRCRALCRRHRARPPDRGLPRGQARAARSGGRRR